jgi:hypothetical protein
MTQPATRGKGRPRNPTPRRHYSILMTDALRARLEELAALNNRTLAQEILARLEKSMKF